MQEQDTAAPPSTEVPGVLAMIPDFSLQDLSGATRFLKDYRGKTVLINFTTTWCPYCTREIPSLKNMYSSFNARGFELIAIYVNESREKVTSFTSKNDLPWTVLLDSDGTVAKMFGVTGVPTKFLVKKDGSIACGPCVNVDTRIDELLKE